MLPKLQEKDQRRQKTEEYPKPGEDSSGINQAERDGAEPRPFNKCCTYECEDQDHRQGGMSEIGCCNVHLVSDCVEHHYWNPDIEERPPAKTQARYAQRCK